MKPALFFCLIISFLSSSTQASSGIELHSINYPVWVIRNQQLIALGPGTELFEGDSITTGKFGRAWISMQDGSVVKLGQNARFEITSANFKQEQDSGLLDATLQVIVGAFRFTSGFFKSGLKTSHQVKIKVGTFTAGIRGTDIWGRSTDEEDFITLLEGSISIQTKTAGTAILSKPLTAYRQLKGQADGSISNLEIPQVEKLAQQTELSIERGIASIDGKYDLVLMSLKSEKRAHMEMEKIQQAGYAVTAESTLINNTAYTRLLLPDFKDMQSAENMARHMLEEFQIENIWIRNKPVNDLAE